MLLRSNFDGLHHLMFQPRDTPVATSPRGLKEFANPVGSAIDVTLFPGVNAVTDEIWDEAKAANPLVAKLIAAGQFEELGSYDPNGSAEDTVKLVQECVQLDFLRALQEHDTRRPVIEAVAAQLVKIDTYVKHKEQATGKAA
jgi:hypothetical protein